MKIITPAPKNYGLNVKFTSESENQIFLRRKLKVWIINQSSPDTDSTLYVATILKNIEPLGFIFSKPLIDQLSTLSVQALQDFYKEIVPILKKMVGAHVQHKPMYPNFPKQVMDMNEFHLYFNAILHYLGFGLPQYEKEERLPLFENTTARVIETGSLLDYHKIFANLMSSKTSLSETDKEDLATWIHTNINVVPEYLPESFGTKENMSFVVGRLLQEGLKGDGLQKCFKTATDILRLAVALSDGDISLAANTKFKSFSRTERKLLLHLLNEVKNPLEDMERFRGQWVRLGERLHPGEYKQFSKAIEVFKTIRSKDKIETFNSRTEKAILKKDISSAVYLLSKRPGEYARRLDKLLRIAKGVEIDNLISAFEKVSTTVSSTVLLQVMTHFKRRHTKGSPIRSFFPKGNVAKVHVIDNYLPVIDCADRIVKICITALTEQYKDKPYLGKCYIDPTLKGYIAPFSQRSASKPLKTLVRGSRIDLPEGNIIRFFLWWKDGNERTDIDLSTVIYDENWNMTNHCGYTNLRDSAMTHSGDITSAPKGAAEFIDVDMTKIQKEGRFLLMSLNSYTKQSYSELPECFAGWMIRKKQHSGEIFEPKTVQNKIDLTADTKICIPIIVDLKERKVIWADLALKALSHYHGNNVHSNQKGLASMAQAIYELQKTNLYDLFLLNANARGTIVETKEEADIVFSVNEGITPFDTEVIMSEYL